VTGYGLWWRLRKRQTIAEAERAAQE
jgi:hypothetical protein